MPQPLLQTRRHFLAQTGAGFGWTALTALMAKEARPPAVSIDPVNPWLPRIPVHAPKAKNVIFLFLVGGPSSIDTLDYKPALAKLNGQKVPTSIRKAVEATKHANVFVGATDEIMSGPWNFAQYGESGLWMSDMMPHLTRHADDLCLIHSLQADSNNHGPASIQLHTGEIIGGKASLGSWVTYGLGTQNQNLPAYVLLFEAGPLGGSTNYSNGFLPAAFQGTRLRSQGLPVADLMPPQEFAPGQRQTLDVLKALNLKHRAEREGFSELDARIASYELSWSMQAAALDIGKLESEPASVQKAYGLDSSNQVMAKFARKCLMARRLVERGVRFVQVYDMAEKDGWDAHEGLKKNHSFHAAAVDQPISALLDDLKQTGLWDETLVICASEFGRTPMKQGKEGRQHNAAGFTAWLAGGAVKPGYRYGATDEIGLMAVDKPVHFRDFHATILAALGINHDALYYETAGRLERLTGVQRTANVIREILA